MVSGSFLTKPAKPDKPAAAKAGSQKLRVTSSVTGDGTITHWEIGQKLSTAATYTWSDLTGQTTTSLSHTVTGLDNAKSYHFKVRAVNATGESAESDASDAASPSAASLTASAQTTDAATLTLAGWGSAWWLKRTTPADTTCKSKGTTLTESLTSLDSNKNYTYKAYSDSTCTTEVVSGSFLTKPAKPDKPAAAKAGSQKLRVTSSVTGDGTITHWEIGQKLSTAATYTWSDLTGQTTTSLSHTVTGLDNAKSYHFKVRAVNATGESAESDASDAASPSAASLTASAQTTDAATLTLAGWGSAWWLKRTTPADTTCKSKGTTLTESLTSLDSNKNYTYKAYSDSTCTTEVVSGSFLTKPAKPDKPAAAKAGSQKLRVTSSVTGDGTITHWEIGQKLSTAATYTWSDLTGQTTTSLSHTVTGLDNAKSYHFKVRAVNATGESAESDASDAASPSAASLTASAQTTDAATLTLAGWGSAWWLKRTTPADTTCKSKGTTLTESLTSLDSNKNYTYKAYSDSTCTTEVVSGSFLTKPAKPDKPAAAKAGSQKLRVTSSVTGDGTITHWEIGQKLSTAATYTWSDLTGQTTTSLSHTVTGLDNAKSYHFKVRAVNATGESAESDASDAASPSAASLTASAQTTDAATLTLAGWGSAWWLKRTTPADTTCKSKGTTLTESLTSLDSNKNYTYKAYSDSTCTTEVVSGSFLTKPAKPDKPAAAKAGSQKLRVTSSVTGDGTITHWEIGQKLSTAATYTWSDLTGQTTTSLSHTVTGLDNAKSYHFKVRAVNATGESAESDASDAASPSAASLTASAQTTDAATLTLAGWGSAWWLKRTTPADTTCKSKGTTLTESLTSLDSNKNYTYKAYSDSTCTTEVVSGSFLTKPAKPDKPAAAKAGSQKLRVTSSVTGDGTITHWEIGQKLSTAATYTWSDLTGQTTTSLSHTVTGLDNAKSYHFKVRAVNATGESAESDASDAASPSAASLTASAQTTDAATLTLAGWGSAWWLKRTTPADTTCKSKGTTLTESLTSLDSNKNYTYKAYSDSTCTTEVVSGSFLTKPAKPDKPAAAKAGSQKLRVTSSVTGDGTITHWEIGQKLSTAATYTWSDLTGQTTTSLSHTVTGLDNAKSYHFKVRAVNATGESAESDASDAASPSAASLTASAQTTDAATLTLAGWGSAWWLKRTTPADTTCKSKGTTLTESLTSLDSNKNYTYKAYSDSTCTTEVVSGSFLTKPAKPDKPAAAKAGSQKLRVTSSVTGDGTITHWEIGQKLSTAATYTWSDLTGQTTTSLSHTVTGLDNAKSYHFKVRAVNATGESAESDASDAASPSAASLTASAQTTDAATLTLAGWGSAWWLKRTTPADTTCKSKGTTLTESLTSLDSNKNYTYKAYSDSTCTTEVVSGSFLTKPAKPDKPAAAKAGSQKLRVTSSVTGDGTITHWEIGQKLSTAATYTWSDLTGQTTTSLSHTVTGLDNAKSYHFKVRAVNATGESAESDASDAASPSAASLTASAQTTDAATLTLAGWGSAWWLKRTTPADTTCKSKGTTLTESLTSLDSNKNYTYKAYSDSTCTTEVVSGSFLTKPAKPDKPAAAKAGSQKLRVTSSVTGDGTITHWEIGQKLSTAATYTWSDLTGQTTTSLSHTVTGLDNAKSYHFKVRAVNATGESAESDASDAASPSAASLTASAQTTDAATLTLAGWGSAWWLKRTTPADTTCKSKGTTLTESLTSLDSNKNYTYKAYSDSTCTTEVVSGSFLTKPAKPDKPAAAKAGSQKLRVTSSVTGDGTITHWEIGQKLSTAATYTWSDLTGQTTTSLSHTVTGLDNAKSYHFKVRAVNATGESAESDASDAASPSAASLTASAQTTDAATLTLAGWGSAWWLKRTTPADTTCKSKGTTLTESLTSLDSNKNYTYKAYSDSTCTTEVVSGSFLTKPAKPDKPAAAKAGSQKLRVTSSVTGDGTITHWEIGQKLSTAATYTWSDLTGQTTTSLSHTVTGLDNAKSYHFKVRAVNATGESAESDASDAASPSAASLTASAQTTDAATLTLAGWGSAWWLKRTTPADTTCKSKGTTLTESLTSLDSNKNYTYKAYSDSTCTTEVVSGSFLTKPAKPDKPAAAKAGSQKLRVTSSVTGDGTITHWEIGQKLSTAATYTWSDLTGQTTTSLSHTVTGLDNAKSYHFKVRAVNATGESAESDASDAASPSAASADGLRADHRRGDPDAGRLGLGLVAEAHHAGGHHLQVEGHDADGVPHEPGQQQELHLQGLQRQHLHDRGGEREFPDQAGQAGQAGGGEGGQPEAAGDLVGDRRRHNHPLGDRAEAVDRRDLHMERSHRPDHDLAEPHRHRPRQRQVLPLQGAGRERHRRERGVGRLGRGAAVGGDAHAEFGGGNHRNPHPRRLDRQLALHVHAAGGRPVLRGANRNQRQPREPDLELGLPVQGLQRQRLLHGTDQLGHTCRVPHQAAQGLQAHGHGGRPHAHPVRVGDRLRHAVEVAVPAEGQHRHRLRDLDRHLVHLDQAESRRHRPHPGRQLPVQAAGRERHGPRGGVRRLRRGHATRGEAPGRQRRRRQPAGHRAEFRLGRRHRGPDLHLHAARRDRVIGAARGFGRQRRADLHPDAGAARGPHVRRGDPHAERHADGSNGGDNLHLRGHRRRRRQCEPDLHDCGGGGSDAGLRRRGGRRPGLHAARRDRAVRAARGYGRQRDADVHPDPRADGRAARGPHLRPGHAHPQWDADRGRHGEALHLLGPGCRRRPDAAVDLYHHGAGGQQAGLCAGHPHRRPGLHAARHDRAVRAARGH